MVTLVEQPLGTLAAHALGRPTDTALTCLRLQHPGDRRELAPAALGSLSCPRHRSDRDVAVKVLSPEFADDSDACTTIARAISALRRVRADDRL